MPRLNLRTGLWGSGGGLAGLGCCYRSHCATCLAEGAVDASVYVHRGVVTLVPNGGNQELVGAVGRALVGA